MSIFSTPPDSANVDRGHWPVEWNKSINLYIANGRCGGCFDAWGLQHQPSGGVANRVSNTALFHAEVFHHGPYGLDEQVPIARIRWSEAPSPPTKYRQTLVLSRGRLITRFHNDDLSYRLETWSDPDHRDCLYFSLRWKAISGKPLPEIVLEVGTADACLFALSDYGYNKKIHKINPSHGIWTAHPSGLALPLRESSGSLSWVLAFGPTSRKDDIFTEVLREGVQRGKRADKGWRNRWGHPKPPAFPSVEAERLWWRGLYSLLSSYAPDTRAPAPPMGYSGNAWGRHFPQDLSYIHPVFLKLGYLDIAKAMVDFYFSRIEQQRSNTRRIYGKPGVLWAWEFPIGTADDLLLEGTPNAFQYEIHNAAYPARMAYETAQSLRDVQWSRDCAWPVLFESALFLASCMSRGDDGCWGIHVVPSMGQDEYGGENAHDYLCALFAAEYTLRAAAGMAGDLGIENEEVSRWTNILLEGIAYRRLVEREGFYRSNADTRFVTGKQKHPVQLNPLTFLPLGTVDEPTHIAWKLRHRICSVQREGVPHAGVPGTFYEGWTLFAFLLAAARMQDREGFAHELKQMIASQSVDPDCITIYESSGYWMPYYTTSMGLFLQALMALQEGPEEWLKRAPPSIETLMSKTG